MKNGSSPPVSQNPTLVSILSDIYVDHSYYFIVLISILILSYVFKVVTFFHLSSSKTYDVFFSPIRDTCPTHLPWFDHINNIWWSIQFMMLNT